MGKGDPCEICGGTESNLVDGFYYCAECGTQDTNVRETLVEHTVLADGTFAIARSQKITLKIKEGVRMSNEWYKWHTYNFKLAGLAEQLVQLGAPRSLKMKVLWIWTRYVRKFQNKEEMRRTQMFSQLQDESQSEHSEDEQATMDSLDAGAGGARLRRVSRPLLAAMLGVALNLDRGVLQLSHFTRLVRHGLLAINDTQRFVPAELRPRAVDGYDLQTRPLSACLALPVLMGRVAARLDLGPFLTPDPEALLAQQLRDLRLPSALGRLARALMHRAPIPFRNRHHLKILNAFSDRYPDYEAVVLAYVLVALKMCFGLDDDYEARLSAAVERVNERQNRPRAYDADTTDPEPPEPAQRLFSFREWCVHLQFRTQVLCANYASLASERNLRAGDYVFMEHFEDLAGKRRDTGGKKKKHVHAIGDEVTMDIIAKIPAAGAADVVPVSEVRPCMAQLAPHAALARVVTARVRDPRVRRLLSEDFTRYSVDYAYRTFSLPDSDCGDLFAGVGEAGKTFRDALGDDLVVSRSDPTIVLVRNCDNKNWTKTKRPTAHHVVTADEDAAEPDAEPDPPDGEKHGEVALETFEEEIEGKNIFDDDFLDVTVKEEIKIDYAPENVDETKDNLYSNTDYFANFDSSFHENVWNDRSEDGNVERRLVFDSDEEGPQFDPTTFDRQETLKNIMAAAYREYKMPTPVRFATLDGKRHDKTRLRKSRNAPNGNKQKRQPDKRARQQTAAAVAGLLGAYNCTLLLHGDALRRPAQHVEASAGDDSARGAECASPAADAVPTDPSDTRDVEVIDNDSDKTDDDDFIDGPMEDPVYKGDIKFDEKTHDSHQLYIKLTDAPEFAPAAPDVGSDEDAAKILDEKITGSFPKRAAEKKEKVKKCKETFTPLVDNPERMTKFNYWFKHYKSLFRKDYFSVTRVREMEETLPRSFRFVLREGAALLQQPPVLLYRYVMDVEARVLALVGARRTVEARSADHGSRQPGKGKRARRKPDDSGETVAREAGTVSPSSKRKKGNERARRRSEDAETELDDDREDNIPDHTSKENSIADDGMPEEDTPTRRSRRLRDKADTDPFWQ